MRNYFIAAALAVVAASPALAATQTHYRNAAQAESSYAFAVPYNAVIIDGRVIGQDPDAFIRGQLLRAGDPVEQNGGN